MFLGSCLYCRILMLNYVSLGACIWCIIIIEKLPAGQETHVVPVGMNGRIPRGIRLVIVHDNVFHVYIY